MIQYSLDGYQRRAIRQVGTSPREFYTHEGPLKVVGSLTEGSSSSLKTFIFGTDGNSPEYIRYQGADLRVIKDHLGSVRLIVNSSTGAIVQRIDYNDIGGVTSDTNPGFQPYGFAGGIYDYQTGLVKFGAREYDSEVGRWTGKDPILFAGGDVNLYGYVENDPVNWVDPDGLTKSKPGQVLENDPFAGGGGGPAGSTGGSLTIQPTSNCPNISSTISPKIQSQMNQRGWNTEMINNAISTPGIPATGKLGPATRFVDPGTGQSIIIDNSTGQIFHVGGPGYKY